MSKLKPSNRGLALAALAISVGAFVMASIAAATATPRVIVRKGDIAPGAVTSKALEKGAVTSAKIRKHAVTAPKVAEGAIRSVSLASESVNKRVLKKEAVGTVALAKDSVTSAQIAPRSVYLGALGVEETIQAKEIKDLDQAPHNGEWTYSNPETVFCNPGELLVGTGYQFTKAVNGEAIWVEVKPYLSGPQEGVTGRIQSDAGGNAGAVIIASCLH